ncbi:hypothetical protein PPL_07074 [Heterostelium album PN500]|uniref:Uncharacterized protein n=1 Tax=Heterostelium pallidum (strain ATCC 26659 / Pp 5 / PN500) TaxID=670386 RepID=D3BEB8_HETP5|nr:hypothetical protein PPL_07074 [Heterostelium album PN500]EFA80249.1 hypothetical protein PPL_07074 [Heterostelium album PN500]|eukprot:XP_020432369.1 hypothetical protein PPL_07074 [Heterostelium album PN500]
MKEALMNNSETNENGDELIFNDLFINKVYTKKEVECCGLSVNLYVLNSASTDYDLTGQVIWPAAKMLTRYIVNNSNIYDPNNPILEVGSGVGVCGLFLARLGKRCILSDYNDIVVDLLKMNIEQSTKDGYPTCECIKLDWSNQSDIENTFKQSTNSEGFDTIIGSDVVYWQSSIEPLFQTVNQLLSHKESSSFILCYQSRSSQTDQYLIDKSVEYGFIHYLVPTDTIFKVDQSSTTENQTSLLIEDEYLLSIMKFIIFKRKPTQ